MKVSILISVYNRPTLVHRCLESCVKQTMSRDEYEIVVVDDCSTDNTFEVLKEWESKYPKLIRIFQLSENSHGASKPRNIGIEKSTGQYVFFLDSDDEIDPNTLTDAYNLTRSGTDDEVDLLIIRLDGTLKCTSRTIRTPEMKPYTRDDWKITYTTVGDFFKRSRLLELNLTFDERTFGGEDSNFLLAFMFRIYDLKWDILGKAEGDYYITDQTRSSTDLGVNSTWIKKYRDEWLVREVIAKIADDPRIADKANFALTYFIHRDESLAVLKSVGDWHIKRFSQLFLQYVPKEVDDYCSSDIKPFFTAIREGDRGKLLKAIDNATGGLGFIREVNDFYKYLSYIKAEPRLIVAFALSDVPAKRSANSERMKEKYWIFEKFFQLSDRSYSIIHKQIRFFVGIIDATKPVAYKITLNNEIDKEVIIDGSTWHLVSTTFNAGIYIDGTNYSVDKNGLNIVVYDKENKKVIDSVCFDTNDEFRAYRN